MKKLFVLAFTLCAFVATPALAETSIGVVNIAKITQASKAATSLSSQIQSKQKAFQNELDSKEKQLLAEDQALVKQKSTTEKAEFDKKVKEFREKAAKEQRAVQEKKAALNKSFSAADEEIRKNVLEIVKKIASEKKLTIVVSSAQVLYSEPALDITDEVLKQLDAKLPTVSVKF